MSQRKRPCPCSASGWSDSQSVLVLPSPTNATPFFEPFSRTSYWTRQDVYVKLLANGSYSVAVWDDREQVGRYVFVIGDREVLGGDLAFPLKMKDYWKPIDQPISGNHPGNAQANQTSAEQGSQKPMAQPGLGIIISLPSMAAAAFILLKKGLDRMGRKTEKPYYTILRTLEKGVEIREYDSQIRTSTQMGQENRSLGRNEKRIGFYPTLTKILSPSSLTA
jgi:hypothetical protein